MTVFTCLQSYPHAQRALTLPQPSSPFTPTPSTTPRALRFTYLDCSLRFRFALIIPERRNRDRSDPPSLYAVRLIVRRVPRTAQRACRSACHSARFPPPPLTAVAQLRPPLSAKPAAVRRARHATHRPTDHTRCRRPTARPRMSLRVTPRPVFSLSLIYARIVASPELARPKTRLTYQPRASPLQCQLKPRLDIVSETGSCRQQLYQL